MARQINAKKVLEEKSEVVKYTLFNERKSNKLEWFLEIYKKDPYKARVVFLNNNLDCSIQRNVCFERADGSFEICYFNRKFGMTKTNRIYSREKKIKSLIYKNKKFYIKIGNSLKHAMFVDVSSHFNFAMVFLLEKFPWLRNIKENEFCQHISLSNIMTYKLFNADKALKHLYKVPSPVVNVLTKQYRDSLGNPYSNSCVTKFEWKRISPYLTNIENLTIDHFKNYLFRDTIEMAIKLNKKVNCSWSEKRIKLEHDKWSKEIRKIMLEFEPLIQLNPYKIYEDFEKFSGYKLLRTNHDLMEEGQRQDHCVAGYSNSVSSGRCGIYQVDGYTLEVNYRSDYSVDNRRKKLFYSQLRGFRNCSAPKELNDKVNDFIDDFNKQYDFDEYEKYLKSKNYNENETERYALPF